MGSQILIVLITTCSLVRPFLSSAHFNERVPFNTHFLICIFSRTQGLFGHSPQLIRVLYALDF